MKIPRFATRVCFALPWIVALGLVVWLIDLRFPIDGVRTFSFSLNDRSPWMDLFLPTQRTTSTEDGVGQRIFHEPVYASARVPGRFDRVTITLDAQTVHQPLVEFGILRDAKTFAFELHPLWSEALSHGWRRVDQLVAGKRWQGYVREGAPDDALWKTHKDRVRVWDAPWKAEGVKRFTATTDLDGERVQAIITSYQTPWQTSFDLVEYQDRPKFILSAPGIKDRNGHIDIRGVRLTFTRPPFSWIDLWNELRGAWRHL